MSAEQTHQPGLVERPPVSNRLSAEAKADLSLLAIRATEGGVTRVALPAIPRALDSSDVRSIVSELAHNRMDKWKETKTTPLSIKIGGIETAKRRIAFELGSYALTRSEPHSGPDHMTAQNVVTYLAQEIGGHAGIRGVRRLLSLEKKVTQRSTKLKSASRAPQQRGPHLAR